MMIARFLSPLCAVLAFLAVAHAQPGGDDMDDGMMMNMTNATDGGDGGPPMDDGMMTNVTDGGDDGPPMDDGMMTNVTDGGDDGPPMDDGMMTNATDGDAPTAAPAASVGTSAPDLTIDYPALTEVVAAEPSLATLATALAAASALNSSAPFGPFDGGNYTLFAPEDDAFDPDLVAKLLEPEYILHLQELLKFHVTMPTPERVLSGDLMDGMELTMLTEDTVTVGVAAGTVTVSTETNITATVIDADNLASNGNVHIVDSVLVPKFLATDLLTLARDFEDYSTLVELLDASGVIASIPMGVAFTIFAPNNAAFEKLGTEALEMLKSDTAALTLILANHVLLGVVPSVLLSDGQTATAVGTLPLTFSIVGDTVTVNGATVVDPNVLASDGIVHGIDTVLMADMMPPDTNTTTMPPLDGTDAPSYSDSPVMSPPETMEPTPAPGVDAPPSGPTPVAPPTPPPTSGVASVSCVLAGMISVILAVAMA